MCLNQVNIEEPLNRKRRALWPWNVLKNKVTTVLLLSNYAKLHCWWTLLESFTPYKVWNVFSFFPDLIRCTMLVIQCNLVRNGYESKCACKSHTQNARVALRWGLFMAICAEAQWHVTHSIRHFMCSDHPPDSLFECMWTTLNFRRHAYMYMHCNKAKANCGLGDKSHTTCWHIIQTCYSRVSLDMHAHTIELRCIQQ